MLFALFGLVSVMLSVWGVLSVSLVVLVYAVVAGYYFVLSLVVGC